MGNKPFYAAVSSHGHLGAVFPRAERDRLEHEQGFVPQRLAKYKSFFALRNPSNDVRGQSTTLNQPLKIHPTLRYLLQLTGAQQHTVTRACKEP